MELQLFAAELSKTEDITSLIKEEYTKLRSVKNVETYEDISKLSQVMHYELGDRFKHDTGSYMVDHMESHIRVAKSYIDTTKEGYDFV